MKTGTIPAGGLGRTWWIALLAVAMAVVAGASRVQPAQAAAGEFEFEHAVYYVTEGDSINDIRIVRTGGGDSGSFVSYGTDDDHPDASAHQGDDYQQWGGLPSWATNDDEKNTHPFVTNDNNDADGTRTAILILTVVGGGATLGTNATAEVIIFDDESGDEEFRWGGGAFEFNESAGEQGVPVVRFGPNDTEETVKCQRVDVSGQDATHDVDFELDPEVQTITFDAHGSRTEYCMVRIIQDSVIEGDENFGLELFDESAGDIAEPNPVVVTIKDDDSAGTLRFTSANYNVVEDVGSGIVTLTVERVGGTTGAASVEYATSAGTASAGSDYVTKTGTLNFSTGQSSRTIEVEIVDNSTVEPTETFTVTLSNPAGAVLGSPSAATVTITDDDGVGTFSFSAADYSAPENSGTATITVLRQGTSSGTASVQYSTSAGTATPGVDYTQIPLTTLNFADGQTSATFAVTIIDDVASETNETVNLTLSNPSGGFTLGSQQTALLTIVDNETQQPVVTGISPTQGPSTGGNLVTISGTNLLGATQVLFGSTSATISNATNTQVLVIAPAGAAGPVNVRVTTPVGTSAVTSNGVYTYLPVPAVTSVSPQSGPIAGGTAVSITGSNFTGATQVLFGNTAASSFTIVSDTQINAVSPAGAEGDVQVRVQNANGLSATSLATRFTYGAAQAATVTIPLSTGWSFKTWLGRNGITPTQALRGQESPDNPATIDIYNLVTVIWYWNGTQWLAFFPAGVNVPGANTLTSMPYGQPIWVYANSNVNWVTVQGP